MISLQSVTKRFGGKVAVDDVTLDIKPGEFFAFLGPNGAGKTTTIKMVAGLLQPTSGRVLVGSYDVQKDYLEAKRIMSYVPDQPYLYDKLSGLEFLHFVADMYGVNGEFRGRELDRWVDLFGMRAAINDLTETYSHGMKQRLVLAATLLHRPKVIVVDEPLVGLDPPMARLVKTIFREQIREGISIFMSTHIISIAEDCADRIGIILNGKVVALGSVEELRDHARIDGNLERVFFKIMEENGVSMPDVS